MIKIFDIEFMIKFCFLKFIILLFFCNIDILLIIYFMGIVIMIINCGVKLVFWIKIEVRFLCMNYVCCVLLLRLFGIIFC